MIRKDIEEFRFFLKDRIRQMIDFSQTDQSRGLEPPPIEKPYDENINLINLPDFHSIIDKKTSLYEAINNRRSCRVFKKEPLTLEELSFLLYTTQGIQKIINPAVALRTVPSAGCRHSFETYITAINVEGLTKGVYRYLPIEHSLITIRLDEHIDKGITTGSLGQSFTGNAAVNFIWSTIPYRMEWRYGLASHKVIAIDIGHVCQNLYLSAWAIGCGVCAIAAYNQSLMDKLIEVDGVEEFVVYMASAGKIDVVCK